jgi:hypothetical protein
MFTGTDQPIPPTKRAKLVVVQEDNSKDNDESSTGSSGFHVDDGDCSDDTAELVLGGNSQMDREHLRMWLEEDRSVTLKLFKNLDVAMYEWDERGMELTQVNPSHLPGDYSILFVHGVGHDTDQDWGDKEKPLSRTVPPGAKLSFIAQTLREGDDGYSSVDQTFNDCVLGNIEGVLKSGTDPAFDFNWEYTIQMNEVKLRLCAAHSEFSFVVGFGRYNRGEEQECQIKVLTNSGSFRWRPREVCLEERDDAYFEFMEEEAFKYHNWSYWKEENSWLCRQKGLPVKVARRIHCYCRHAMPPILFEWEPGDLLVVMELCDYATSWTTIYLARPNDDGHRKRLVDAAKSCA